MRTAIVTGAGGFIGTHLVRRLRSEGYWVRGVDLKVPQWGQTVANDFVIADLRDPRETIRAFDMGGDRLDEVYALAADMGGMGFIEAGEWACMSNNQLINQNTLHCATQTKYVQRYFFASSQCVYGDTDGLTEPVPEEFAYEGYPDNEYGFEKLYTERLCLCAERHEWPNAPEFQVRIARFGNTYGPEGTYEGGREKAPAAMCRKVATCTHPDNGIEVWGDGTAIRSYLYIDDLIDGIRILMQSDCSEPVNISSNEYVTVDELLDTAGFAGGIKPIPIHVHGPVGVKERNFSTARMGILGWEPKTDLRNGLIETYKWIEGQIREPETA